MRFQCGRKFLKTKLSYHLPTEFLRLPDQWMRVTALEQLSERASELLRVERVDERAEAAITQRVHRAVTIAGEDRLAASHRFEEDDAKPLPHAGHGKDIAEIIVSAKFLRRDKTGEMNTVGHAGGTSKHLKSGPVIAGAADQVMDFRHIALDAGQRGDDAIKALVSFGGSEPTKGEHNRRVVRQSVALEQFGRFRSGIDIFKFFCN